MGCLATVLHWISTGDSYERLEAGVFFRGDPRDDDRCREPIDLRSGVWTRLSPPYVSRRLLPKAAIGDQMKGPVSSWSSAYSLTPVAIVSFVP